MASARLSLYSPFQVEDRYKNYTFRKVNDYFKKICASALEILESKKMMNIINKKIYQEKREKKHSFTQTAQQIDCVVLLLFDALFADLCEDVTGINVDQFRALVFKYSLHREGIIEADDFVERFDIVERKSWDDGQT